MKFREGDKVLLKASNQFGSGPENPAVGSRWACEGIISNVSTRNEDYDVLWKNGERNGGYEDDDLQAVHNSKSVNAPDGLLNWPEDHKAVKDFADIGERKLAAKDQKKKPITLAPATKLALRATVRARVEAHAAHIRAVTKRRSRA